MKKYVFHSDAGHGWCAVKRAELKRLGILDKISHYSYQKGQTVYLEEDCDFTTFADAKEKHGEALTQESFRESYQDHSPIRNYPRFVK